MLVRDDVRFARIPRLVWLISGGNQKGGAPDSRTRNQSRTNPKTKKPAMNSMASQPERRCWTMGWAPRKTAMLLKRWPHSLQVTSRGQDVFHVATAPDKSYPHRGHRGFGGVRRTEYGSRGALAFGCWGGGGLGWRDGRVGAFVFAWGYLGRLVEGRCSASTPTARRCAGAPVPSGSQDAKASARGTARARARSGAGMSSRSKGR